MGTFTLPKEAPEAPFQLSESASRQRDHPAGPGPYTGDFTARISKVDAHGVVTTVADHLPSSQTSPALGNLVSGVGDVAFIDGTLYALICGRGLFARTSGDQQRYYSSQCRREPDPDRGSQHLSKKTSNGESRAGRF